MAAIARTGTFTNSNGESFVFMGIPPKLFSEMKIAQEKRWKEEGRKLPIIPTYETSAEEIIEWDRAAVMQDGTQAEKEEWLEYERTYIAFQEEYNLRRAKVVALYLQDDPADDEDWVSKMEMAGIEMPDKPQDRKVLYMNTKVLVGAFEDVENDFIRLLVFVQSLSGAINKEVAEAFEATFRFIVERDNPKRSDRITPKNGKMASKQHILSS